MLLPGALVALVATAGVFGGPAVSAGRAAPRVRLQVQADCPGDADLRRAFAGSRMALAEEDETDAAGDWVLFVTRDPDAHTSHLTLRAGGGEVAFERDVPGSDCAGIAGAAAVVVEAYFMEIHLLGDPPPEAEPPPRPPDAPATAPIAAPSAKRAPPVRPGWTLVLGAAGGGVVYVDPALSAWALELSAGVRRNRWSAALSAAFASATTQETPPDRVERSERDLHVDLAHRFPEGRWWLEPGMSLHALHSRVVAPDLPGEPAITRLDLGAGASATAGMQLTPTVAITAVGAGTLLLRRDQYAIEPAGVIARSPAGRLFVGAGVRWDLPL